MGRLDDSFQSLLEKLLRLAEAWDEEFEGKELSSFDGVFEVEYMSPDSIGNAVRFLELLYSDKPHEDLRIQRRKIDEDFEELFDVWNEYLHFGEFGEFNVWKSIAYAIYRVYDRYKDFTTQHDKLWLDAEHEKLEQVFDALKEKGKI